MPDEIDEFRELLSAQRERTTAQDAEQAQAKTEAARAETERLKDRAALSRIGQRIVGELIRSATSQDSIYQVTEVRTKFIVERFTVRKQLAVSGWIVTRTETRHTIGIGDSYAGTTIDGLLLSPRNELFSFHNMQQDGDSHTFRVVTDSWNPSTFRGTTAQLSYNSNSVNVNTLRQAMLNLAERHSLNI